MDEVIPDERRAAALRDLPGVQPVGGPDWITVDADYAAQMAERARLLSERRGDVLAVTPGAEPACAEALEEVLALLDGRADFAVGAAVRRPDGATVDLDGPPLEVLGRLIAEDICILEKCGAEHVLTAALLCFPASWTLAEKIGRPLLRIHRPVEDYDAVAPRVQRLFDGVQPGGRCGGPTCTATARERCSIPGGRRRGRATTRRGSRGASGKASSDCPAPAR